MLTRQTENGLSITLEAYSNKSASLRLFNILILQECFSLLQFFYGLCQNDNHIILVL